VVTLLLMMVLLKKLKMKDLDALVDILGEVENKAVIWAHYRYDINAIINAVEKNFGADSYVTYYGDTSNEDRQKAIKEIQDPIVLLDLLLVHHKRVVMVLP
jgi:hypothetical protein